MNLILFGIMKRKGGLTMGRDRHEKKLKRSRSVESDRDQSLKYAGATRLESPEEARERNKK
jgi:hypothetical protein